MNEYLAGYWKTRPGSAATAAGVHTYDRQLEDYSTLSLQQDIQNNREFLSRLERIEEKTLSADARVDRRMLLDHVRLTLLDLEQTCLARTSPQRYISLLGAAVSSLMKRQFASTQSRYTSLAERVKLIPRLLKQARLNLENPPELFTRKAIEMIPETADFLEKGVPRSALEQGVDKKILARLQKEAKVAAAALRDFGQWLEKELLPKSKGDFTLGPEVFRQRFRYALETELTPEQVLVSAEADLKATHAEMNRLAAQIAPGKPLAEVLSSLSPSYPPGPDLLKAHREAITQGKVFVEKKGLAPVPQPDRLLIEAAPSMCEACSTGVVFDGPGPFEPDLASFYYVPEEGSAAPVPITGMREGYPGRYLQWEAMNRSPAVVRKVFPNPAFVMGWAQYAGQVMYEEGFKNSARDRLMRMESEARSQLDAIVDIRLHCRTIRAPEAMKMLREQGYLEQAAAEKRIERASLYPTELSSEYVGKLEILRLREEQRRLLGAAFVLSEFHQKLLSLGAPPVSAARELIKE